MSKIVLASLTAALALTAAPAAAQTAAATPYFSASKMQAILGGESRLAAIMAQQSGQALPQPSAYSASYGAPLVQARMPIYRPTISMDRPDVFNSVALPISHSSLDRRWRKVANGPVGATSAAYASGLAERSAIEKLAAVNHYVNARVSFVDDSRQYGVADLWTSAADTLRRGRGDCEDYAIAKYVALSESGFPRDDLRLVLARDRAVRQDHAVLAARLDGHWLILDSRRADLMNDSQVTSLTPLYAINHRGVQLLAAPFAKRAPLDGDVDAAPAASSGSDVGEWSGQDAMNYGAGYMSILPLLM